MIGFVRRINVHLDEELDAELAAAAARLGQSKASLLRRAVRSWLDQRAEEPPDDPWSAFTGAVDARTSESGHDDEVIYRA